MPKVELEIITDGDVARLAPHWRSGAAVNVLLRDGSLLRGRLIAIRTVFDPMTLPVAPPEPPNAPRKRKPRKPITDEARLRMRLAWTPERRAAQSELARRRRRGTERDDADA